MTARYVIAALIMLASTAVVIAAIPKLSYTHDEPAHVSTGLQWWETGRYTMEPMHPPLARVILTLPLYYSGVRIFDQSLQTLSIFRNGWKVFNEDEGIHYVERVTMARLALIPFYLLSLVVVFAWSQRAYGAKAALLSLALYATLPPVLAHAGLATTDMAYTSTLLLTLYLFSRWLDSPDIPKSLWLGVAAGLTIASKFSALMHLPIAGAAILAGRCVYGWLDAKPKPVLSLSHVSRLLVVVAPVAAFIIAAIYRFHPVMPIIRGIKYIQYKNRVGHALWLWKPLHNKGVWYFFPVLLFFKTPLPFLFASFAVLARTIGGFDRKATDPVLAAIAIVLISMTSNINLGLRHVLIVYPLLAIPIGHTVLWLSEKIAFKWGVPLWVVPATMLGWQGADVIRYFPEHIAYFNPLAGSNPSRIAIDSDFDWGQNDLLLKEALKARKIDVVTACFDEGLVKRDTDIHKMRTNLNVRFLSCTPHPKSGWVVVKIQEKTINRKKYAWLRQHEPVEKIGQTILLYNLSAITQEPDRK